ncbi:hypothetical protein ACA910_003132 [Epithemia clementina (nom. ined.)]
MSAYALPGLFPPLPRQEFSSERSSFNFEDDAKPCSSSNYNESPGRVGISVKDAKIDSALLVQSLAQNELSPTSSPRSRRRTRSDPTREVSSTSKDEAMQFELSVSFGGQRYTTTRSWPSICKFRKDLIRNVRSIEIPELPSLHPPGVLCRSFSFLQNLVCSYAPALEGWLRTVTVLVPPDNPILSHFLHEEEASDMNCYRPVAVEFEKLPSVKHLLNSIEESETEGDDERGDDIMFEKAPEGAIAFPSSAERLSIKSN